MLVGALAELVETASNILEVVGAYNAEENLVVFHAMPARKGYLAMLTDLGTDNPWKIRSTTESPAKT